jgi:Mn2+/Fe2+ NRAMP family transporter
MGDYVNSRWYNAASWFAVGSMIVLTLAMVVAQIRS